MSETLKTLIRIKLPSGKKIPEGTLVEVLEEPARDDVGRRDYSFLWCQYKGEKFKALLDIEVGSEGSQSQG